MNHCTVLDCWLLSFFSYLLHVILSFYKLSCIEILSLYWSISAFMVYDSNQKDYIQEKRNLFALECVSGISIAYSRLCNEQGMGRIIRTVTVHQVKWGTLASPTWQGDTWGHAGHVAAGFSHNIRAEPGPPPTAVNTLAWHQLSAAGRSTAQLQKVFYRKIMLSSNPPKSVFTFAPLQPLDTG